MSEIAIPSYVKNLSNDDYHNHDSISKTKLDLVDRDLHAVAWASESPVDQDKIKTFDFGDAMHAISLEPDRLKSEFVAMPDLNLRTNAGKAEKKEFEEANTGKKILTPEEYKKLHLMFESIMAHPEARDLIEAEGVAEGSYFWRDDATGLNCRCRPDKEIESRRLLVDIKTTDTLKKFHYSVDDYRYYVQDPFYCDGVGKFKERPSMVFLVVQKHIECGRYPVGVFRLPPEAITEGRRAYQQNMIEYAQFLKSEKPIGDYKELEMSYKFMQMCDNNLEFF